MIPAFDKYFYPPDLPERLIQFSYLVTPKNQILQAQQGLASYLGYKAELNSLAEVWHPKEKKRIFKLEKELLDFAGKHSLEAGSFGIVMVNRAKKASGIYIKILRHIYPVFSDSSEVNQGLICAHCLDVSSLSFEEKVSFKVWKSSEVPFDLESMERHFMQGLSDPIIHFTERQLDVLRAWSELDSAKLVSERLQIEVRTIETHLRNARKRLDCRRTLDAVLYAKEHGLI